MRRRASLLSEFSQLIVNTQLTAHPTKHHSLRVEFASTKDLEAAGEVITWPIPNSDLLDIAGTSDSNVDPVACVQNAQARDHQTGQAVNKTFGQHAPSRQSQETETLSSLEGTSCGSSVAVGVSASNIKESAVSIGLGYCDEK
ncbi:conserved hypothetical protein [Neospora caninum Liverpool]|uniref:Uncharacterized protein n=1 Tax=Neospora caninum (strain Liverpool) TaxID=572307 RepID=F0VJE4_NEOCL|nr:conserved hypothetical protein [Neospora caninum Liverpool]CBZ53855.1 conserved hypothetical protein [Neospora caninum Liverpool]CEL67850.1 TPA: hypothetical protein BN1204_036370 [Neospora caninum Liverpool]|eukprot:XP_003883887.1 conserved hypothetical protein [Neospora caninum Liverpool]